MVERPQLGVIGRIPLGATLEHAQESGRIGFQSGDQWPLSKERSGKPVEALLQGSGIFAIDVSGASAESGFRAQRPSARHRFFPASAILIVSRSKTVVVGITGVENFGVLGAHGYWQTAFERMKENEVAEDM